MPVRECDECGIKMAPHRPRRLKDGKYLCEGCSHDRPGRPLTGALASGVRTFTTYRRGDISDTHDENQMNPPDQPQFHGVVWPDGTCTIRWATAKAATAVWDSFEDMEAIHGHYEDGYGTEVVWDDGGLTASAKAPYISIQGALVKVEHASPDPAVINHCFSCGSGQVIGRSDGTCECSFCGAVFTVQLQPQFSGVPQTDPSMVAAPGGQIPPTPAQQAQEQPPEEEDDDGSFGGDRLSDKFPGEDKDAPAEGEEKSEDEAVGELNAEGVLISSEGVALPEEKFLAHLALQAAYDSEATLAEVRAHNAHE